jgi:hypothetical protein
MPSQKHKTYEIIKDGQWYDSNVLRRDIPSTHVHRCIRDLEKEGFVFERKWASEVFTNWLYTDVMAYRLVGRREDALLAENAITETQLQKEEEPRLFDCERGKHYVVKRTIRD